MTARADDPWSAPVPPVSAAEAAELADRWFGLDASATPLVSERDHNFALTGHDGGRYVLKLTHPAESRAFTLWQSAALLQAARSDPELPVPRLVAARDGEVWAEVEAGGVRRIARIMTLVPGVPLHRAPSHPRQHGSVGRMLARLHRALARLDTAPAPKDLLWDLRRAGDLAGLLGHIADDARRERVAAVLGRLVAETLPALDRLPAQAIHNDFQPWNLLADEDGGEITGIIDFGDMVAAPPVMDLAVACAYHVADGPARAPLGDLEAVVRGYESLRPLTAAERELLLPLTAGRMAMTLAITSWRAGLHPANAAYILRNAEASWAGLARLAGHGA